jgi:hypothetical protein
MLQLVGLNSNFFDEMAKWGLRGSNSFTVLGSN